MKMRPDPGDRAYLNRMHAVMDYVGAHLSATLDLQTVASVAHFSPWHFHRLFHAMTGETLADHVRRRRLEAGAARLLAKPPSTIMSIALDTGFGSAEVFARQFKSHFGVTPTVWRGGAYREWAGARRSELHAIHGHRIAPGLSHSAASAADAARVRVKPLPGMRVAYLRHIGPYGDQRIGQMWQRLVRWSGHRGLCDGRHAFVGVSHDSPDIVKPGTCRYDACVAIGDVAIAAREVGVQDIAGGQFACLPFSGTSNDIYSAWLHLFSQWLPDSGYQPDDRPGIENYGTAVNVEADTGVFSCELCLPVRPL